MSLTIINKQNKYETGNIEKLMDTVFHLVLDERGVDRDCQVSLTLCDNKEIREINREYRKIDRPTDVLSFPMIEYRDGAVFNNDYNEDDIDMDTGEIILGDIVISLERAYEQSVEYGHSFEREISFLMVHGMLHILGFDHESEDDREKMRKEEERILGKLGMER